MSQRLPLRHQSEAYGVYCIDCRRNPLRGESTGSLQCIERSIVFHQVDFRKLRQSISAPINHQARILNRAPFTSLAAGASQAHRPRPNLGTHREHSVTRSLVKRLAYALPIVEFVALGCMML